MHRHKIKRAWNYFFIPYATGDMHIGDTTITYTYKGKQIKVHHNGRTNCMAALDLVFNNFVEPDKLLVSGESSGAFGCAFYTPFTTDHYPNTKIYSLCDAAMLTSNRRNEIFDTVWKSETETNLGFKIGKDIFEDALIHRTDLVKRQIQVLHSNTLYDDVFTKFSAVINHQPTNTNAFIDEWSANTKSSMKRLRKSNIDYNYFITDWGYNPKKHATQHTLTTSEFYHKCTADAISYAEWIKRNVIDDENLSLGEQLLEK